MKIERRKISDLVAYDGNPKTHPKDQVELLKRSLKEFGWTNPVLVDSADIVVAGHGRLEAALQLGMSDAPTIRLDDLTPDQVRAYRILDNKSAELAGWDPNLLAVEFEALADVDFDLDLTGFDMGEISRLTVPPGEDDEAPAPPAEPVTQPGDLWIMGDHRLICGDSTDPETVARVLDGEKPNLMVTDPPYGVEYDADWRNRDLDQFKMSRIGKVQNDDRANWSSAWVLSPANVAYCWSPPGADFAGHDAALRQSGFEPRITIIWAKPNFPIGRGHYHVQHEPCIYAVRKGAGAGWIGDRKQATVWQIAGMHVHDGNDEPADAKTNHSTQKPLECMERPIRNHKGDVYEPFAGSGTTICAAERQSRRCFAIELDPGYCDVIVERWENLSGGKAVRSLPQESQSHG